MTDKEFFIKLLKQKGNCEGLNNPDEDIFYCDVCKSVRGVKNKILCLDTEDPWSLSKEEANSIIYEEIKHNFIKYYGKEELFEELL